MLPAKTMIGTDIALAKTLLQAGELVAIPTETVYGLAANAFNADAVLKIFLAKNRPAFDPLIVHAGSIAQIATLVTHMPETGRYLAEQFMPGPLTLLLPKKNLIPDLVTSGLPHVAVRIPNHPLTLQLLRSLNFPLAAPSANPFGYVSPTTAQHVQDQLGGKIPYILDGGPCSVGIESTIIGFDTTPPTVYRMGGISIEQIEAAIGKVLVQTYSSSNPRTAGMLKSHYAPHKKVVLGNITQLLQTFSEENRQGLVGVLSFKQDYGCPRQVILSPDGNLNEAAGRLFAALRTLDNLPVTVILTEPVPDVDIGRAINDRLKRAAAGQPDAEGEE
ncbi:threonylcarbamoyl-AMP synthase [Sphingobacteriales bacterium UPWRP_1]|nr:threonylcarbamoyl-AMP synthase [Sphingobacteriales bacterium TSM_CSS]PSJ78292.1 threonylcarbamoyl-AMP synthase [Sphingobacteriales bacterium UPWRP_1]